jgi:hypothetical protein
MKGTLIIMVNYVIDVRCVRSALSQGNLHASEIGAPVQGL